MLRDATSAAESYRTISRSVRRARAFDMRRRLDAPRTWHRRRSAVLIRPSSGGSSPIDPWQSMKDHVELVNGLRPTGDEGVFDWYRGVIAGATSPDRRRGVPGAAGSQHRLDGQIGRPGLAASEAEPPLPARRTMHDGPRAICDGRAGTPASHVYLVTGIVRQRRHRRGSHADLAVCATERRMSCRVLAASTSPTTAAW